MREKFLPELGAESLVVVAGRERRARVAGGRGVAGSVAGGAAAQPAAGRGARVSRGRGVADALHAAVLDFTHGHPLALSLLVDMLVQLRGRSSGSDLTRRRMLCVLLQRFVADVPSARHRQALAVCAHARMTNEDLLCDVLGGRDAAALFAWLRGLPFVEHGRAACSRTTSRVTSWRPICAGATGRATRTSTAGCGGTWWRGSGRARAASSSGRSADLHFLHRGNAGIRGFYDWVTLGEGYADGLRAGDVEAVVAMVSAL